jgi:hypothetical protein
MDLSFDNSTSRSARLRRELRNPSMLTIFIILVVTSTIIFAPFVPGWVSTTQDSFAAMAKKQEINEASMSSIGAIVPSQIAPWLGSKVETMINAEGPLDWKVVSFRTGPCDPGNLVQLPASKYSTAIATTCGELDDIQQLYSGNCFLASDCNVPEAAKIELRASMGRVWEAFSDAGFVLPYTEVEQVLP